MSQAGSLSRFKVSAWVVSTAVLLSVAGVACGRPEAVSPAAQSEPENGIRAPWRPTTPGRSVLADYGPLRVPTAGRVERESELKPWSSYFFPLRDPILFGDERGEPTSDSPLAKFDSALKRARLSEGSATQEEKQAWDLGGRWASSWEGLCHAWAFASLLEREPREARTWQGVTFSVADQKALLLKTYELAQPEVHYGVNFRVGPDADWTAIHAEEFHRFVQAELFEKGNPFIMDSDPTDQIWNYPVWYARSDYRVDAADATRVHVTTRLAAAGLWDRSERDRTGSALHPFEYTYDLIGAPAADGFVEVVYGEWTGNSYRLAHPNYLIPMPQKLKRESLNRYLSPQRVDQVLGRAPSS